MKIVTTNIVDRNVINNSEASKVLLMDKLIDHFAPLFYEELRKKQGQLNNNKTDIDKLKKIIFKNKSKLVELQNKVDVETIKNQILQEIEYLNNVDVLYGKNKILVQEIIKSFDNQLISGLKKRLETLQKITKQKLNKKG